MDRIAIIDITSRCNLRCAHCYNQERYWDKESKYREYSYDEIVCIVNKLSNLNFTRIHLLGGEPLMSSNILDMIKEATSQNLKVSIVTNGTLLTKEVMYNLCDLGVSSISISLDGITEESNDKIRGKGVFKKVISNLKESIEIKEYFRKKMGKETAIGISFTLTKANCKDACNLISFIRKNKLDGVNISYLSNEGQARKNLNTLTISEKDKFDFIDTIIEDYKKYLDIELNINARSYLGEYIYKGKLQ